MIDRSSSEFREFLELYEAAPLLDLGPSQTRSATNSIRMAW